MTISDLPIPRTSAIVDRALDYRDSAVRLGDTAMIERIDRLVRDKLPNAQLCWALGTLIIDSPSGHRYHVTRGGCDCLNGRRCGKRQCWHLIVRELLEDLFTTEVETMDMTADTPPSGPDIPDEYPNPTPGGPPPDRPRSAQFARARTLVWDRL